MSLEFLDTIPDLFNQLNFSRTGTIFPKHPVDFNIKFRKNQIAGKVIDHAVRIFLQSGALFAEIWIEFTKPADSVVFIVHDANQCAGILIAESICLNPQRILTKIILSQMIGQFRQFVCPEFLPEPCENFPHGFSSNRPFRNTAIQRATTAS